MAVAILSHYRAHFFPCTDLADVYDGPVRILRHGFQRYHASTLPSFAANHHYYLFKIGTVSVESVPAKLITEIDAPLSPEWDADGFLSLQPPDSSTDTPYDTMSVFLAAFERPLMTLYYARYST